MGPSPSALRAPHSSRHWAATAGSCQSTRPTCSPVGLLPSASLPAGEGAGPALYEPVHGSAPDIAGRGIANPVGAVLSVALMLEHSLGSSEGAAAVTAAVDAVIAAGVRTPDLGGTATTDEVAVAVIAALAV